MNRSHTLLIVLVTAIPLVGMVGIAFYWQELLDNIEMTFHLHRVFVFACGWFGVFGMLVARLGNRLTLRGGWKWGSEVAGDIALVMIAGVLGLLLALIVVVMYPGIDVPTKVNQPAMDLSSAGSATISAPTSQRNGNVDSTKKRSATTVLPQSEDLIKKVEKAVGDAEEKLNKLGTLFAWLIATLTLALTVLVWLVVKAAGEARDDAKELLVELDTLRRIKQHNLVIAVHQASMQIQLQREALSEEHYREKLLLALFWRLFASSDDLDGLLFSPEYYSTLTEDIVAVIERAKTEGIQLDRQAALFAAMRRTVSVLLEELYGRETAGDMRLANCTKALRRLLGLLE